MRTSTRAVSRSRNYQTAMKQIVFHIADPAKLTLKAVTLFVILLFRTNRKQIGKISLRVAE